MLPSSTESANARRAIGGTSARRGLPARNASACELNTAAHSATTAARIKGASGGAGETCTRACSPTRCEASAMCRRVSRVGSPYHVVCGNTTRPTATTASTPLPTVARTRFRRSSADATAAEAKPTAISRHVEECPRKTRPKASAVATAIKLAASSAIRRCERADVPWGCAIDPSIGRSAV